jgi:hypothetical protein
MSPERLAYILGSAALSVVAVVPVEPPVVEVVELPVAEPELPVGPVVLPALVELSLDVELAVVPPVAAGVSADGPQAADIKTIAQAATAARISNRIGKRFRVSKLG